MPKKTKKAKKNPAPKKPVRREKAIARRKKAVSRRKVAGKKPVRAKKKPRRGASAAAEASASLANIEEAGLTSESGGQSGDIQGLPRSASSNSESIEELVEEGQAFEAGVVSGVENAPDADASEVKTREVLEDDVPAEYDDAE